MAIAHGSWGVIVMIRWYKGSRLPYRYLKEDIAQTMRRTLCFSNRIGSIEVTVGSSQINSGEEVNKEHGRKLAIGEK
jgi:hypothetical protein